MQLINKIIMIEYFIKKEGKIMQAQNVKTSYPSHYKPLLKEGGDSDSTFGIIGFDENDNKRFLLENLTKDYKLILYITNLLNSNGVALVHAEDIVYDIFFEKMSSLPKNILHQANS